MRRELRERKERKNKLGFKVAEKKKSQTFCQVIDRE